MAKGPISQFDVAVCLANGPSDTHMESAKARRFLKSDVDLLKVAILYGDGIQLISPSVLQWNDWLAFGNFNTANVELRDRLLRETIARMLGGSTGDGIRSGGIKIAGLDGLPDQGDQEVQKFVQFAGLDGRRSLEGVLDARSALDEISALWSMISNSVQENELPELVQVRKLVEGGRLSLVHPLDPSILPLEDPGAHVKLTVTGAELDPRIENDVRDKFARMLGALQTCIERVFSDPQLFPIFDNAAYGIAERLSRNSTGDLRKLAAPAAGRLFAHLPNFGKATLSEVIDIRDELDDSVRGFQVAMARISAELDESPWQDLDKLSERLWLTQVRPELEEIEYRIRQNSYMRQLADRFMAGPEAALTALGATAAALLGSTTNVGAPGLVAGGIIGALPAAKAAWERRRVNKEIQRSRFFFLYTLNQKL